MNLKMFGEGLSGLVKNNIAPMVGKIANKGIKGA